VEKTRESSRSSVAAKPLSVSAAISWPLLIVSGSGRSRASTQRKTLFMSRPRKAAAKSSRESRAWARSTQ
jgi:hypothetical protein